MTKQKEQEAQKTQKEQEQVIYVKEGGEITDEELANVSGGRARRASKTIHVGSGGYTDTDAGF